MADQQTQQGPMTESLGMPQGADPASMYRAWLAGQMGGGGGTQLGPSLQHDPVKQPQPRQERRTDYGSQYGHNRAALKDLSNSVTNIVGQVTQKIQQRKATEQQHVFDRFTNSVQGIQQAQAEMQEA